jgi:hypothetical protein
MLKNPMRANIGCLFMRSALHKRARSTFGDFQVDRQAGVKFGSAIFFTLVPANAHDGR